MSERAETEWSAWLRAANRGDSASYARFLHGVTPVVRGIVRAKAFGLGGDQHDDIVQEVLLAIHAKRHTWREDSPLRPWLFAITRYKVIDALRKRGTAVHLPVEDFAEVLAAEAAPEPLVQRDLDRALAHIDPRAQEIVRAVSLEGANNAEIAERLSMSEGAVRVAFHRAMKKLVGASQKSSRGAGQTETRKGHEK
ncbi:ECF RNA polymerase sigma factor SigD [Aquimixticola soesokkakensis]|uniref:ECF RNA polymerase sigma factor SigD n=1 Tax=Aquimixticola soesokkakensis TaxID=1519096 RepID=A0A1Y5SPH1_9RHOB|nr:sigma-70 family RNA polymerase sigma factor [Aquimixticola soesokkakensis]SLN43685.1 ECF RNA polymerase sigma factor SigD [Aquimixticola soesokkakensis]